MKEDIQITLEDNQLSQDIEKEFRPLLQHLLEQSDELIEKVRGSIKEARQLKTNPLFDQNSNFSAKETDKFHQIISNLENLESQLTLFSNLKPETITVANLMETVDALSKKFNELSQEEKNIQQAFEQLKPTSSHTLEEPDNGENSDNSNDIDNPEDIEPFVNLVNDGKISPKEKEDLEKFTSDPVLKENILLSNENQSLTTKNKTLKKTLKDSTRDKDKLIRDLQEKTDEKEIWQQKALKVTEELTDTQKALRRAKEKRIHIKDVVFSKEDSNPKKDETSSTLELKNQITDLKQETTILQTKLKQEKDKRKQQAGELVQIKEKVQELQKSIIQRSYSSIRVYDEEDFKEENIQVKDKGTPISEDLLEEQMPVNFENLKIDLFQEFNNKFEALEKFKNDLGKKLQTLVQDNEQIFSDFKGLNSKIISLQDSFSQKNKEITDELDVAFKKIEATSKNSNSISNDPNLDNGNPYLLSQDIQQKLSELRTEVAENIQNNNQNYIQEFENIIRNFEDALKDKELSLAIEIQKITNEKIVLEKQIENQSTESQKSNESTHLQNQINAQNNLIQDYTEKSEKIKLIRNSLEKVKQDFNKSIENTNHPNPNVNKIDLNTPSSIDQDFLLEKFIYPLHESFKLQGENVQSSINLLNNLEKNQKETQGKVSHIEKYLQGTQEKIHHIDEIQKDQTELGKTLNNLGEKVENLRSEILTEQTDLSEKFEKDINDIEENTKERLESLVGRVDTISTRIDTTNNFVQQIKTHFEDTSRDQLNGIKTEISSLQKDLNEKKQALSEQYQDIINQTGKNLEEHKNATESLKNEIDLLNERIENQQRNLNSIWKVAEKAAAEIRTFFLDQQNQQEELKNQNTKLEESIVNVKGDLTCEIYNLQDDLKLLTEQTQTLKGHLTLQKELEKNLSLLKTNTEKELNDLKNHREEDLKTIQENQTRLQQTLISQYSEGLEKLEKSSANLLDQKLNNLEHTHSEQLQTLKKQFSEQIQTKEDQIISVSNELKEKMLLLQNTSDKERLELVQKIDMLNKQKDDLKEEVSDLQNNFNKKLDALVEDFKQQTRDLEKSYQDKNTQITESFNKFALQTEEKVHNFSEDFNKKINGLEKLYIDKTSELKIIEENIANINTQISSLVKDQQKNEENQTKLTQEIKEFQRQQNGSNEQFKDQLNVHCMNHQNLTQEQTTLKEDLNKLKKEYQEQLTALTNEFSIQLKSKEKEIEDLSNKLEEALKSTNEGQSNLKQQISMLLKEKQTLLSEFSNLQKIYNEQIKLLNEKIEHEVEIFKNTHQDLPTIEQISKFSEELNQKILVSQKEISDKIEGYHVNQSNELKEILNKLDESNKEQIELKNTLIKIEDSNKHLISDLQKNTEEKNLLKQDLEGQIQVLKNQQQIDGLAIGQINGFISEHKRKLDENNIKLNDLSSQFNKLEEDQNNNFQELTNLKKDLDQIRNKSGEQTTLNNEVSQRIKSLENQVVSLRTELKDLENLNHQNQRESIQKTSELIEKNEYLQTQLSELKKEYLETTENNKVFKEKTGKEIEELQNQLNEQAQEQENLNKKNELRINSLENQNKEYSERINQLQEGQDKSSNNFLEQQKQHEDEINLINEQAQKLEDLSKKLEQQEEKFQNGIKQLEEKQNKLKGKNRQLKQIKEILNEPKKEVDQKQNVLLLEDELIDQKKVNYELEKKVQFIEKELFEQQKELHQKELQDVKKQNKILQKQLDDLYEKQDEREPRNSKRRSSSLSSSSRSSSLSPSNRGFDYKTVLEELDDEKPSHTTKVETSRKSEEKQPNISSSKQPHMALKVNEKLIDVCTINPDKMNIVKDEYKKYKDHISNGKNSFFQSLYNPQVFPFDRFEVFKQSPFYIEGKHTSRNFPHQITVYKINSLENALVFTNQLERQKAVPEGIFKKVSDETQAEQSQKKGAKSPYEQDILPEKEPKNCKI